MQHYTSYSFRQGPSFKAPLGVTTRVRALTQDRRMGEGAVEYLNSTYVEDGLQDLTTWRGQPVGLAPGDLIALQDILFAKRPERIVVTAPEPALLTFLDDMAQILGLDDMRIVCVRDEPVAGLPERVDCVIGPPYAPLTLSQVSEKLGPAESVMVLFSRRSDDLFPLDELRAYARFVSFGSHLVVLRTVLGQPWLGYSKYWLKRVIYLFLLESDFVIDETCTQHLISVCAGGFLARVKPPAARAEDEALETLAS